jgi:DNA-binding phage protein
VERENAEAAVYEKELRRALGTKKNPIFRSILSVSTVAHK